ncbi:MAG: branched-chain amino acid aminotransferase [SAR202 cluster bacterium]|nr:branched-chain amino acid aminotransferase [SAR202 cluster bacterium]
MSRATELNDGRSTEGQKSAAPQAKKANLGFGRTFTSHMFVMEWTKDRGWHSQRIEPYGSLTLDPAAAVLHYGQALFEGLKAFKTRDGRIVMFRPDRHFKRMKEGAARLVMPEIDSDTVMKWLVELVTKDRNWVPSEPSTALYIRPTLVATEPFLGVRPSESYLFLIIMSPVEPLYGLTPRPLKLWAETKYVRAAPGGLGASKTAANYVASLAGSVAAKSKGFDQVIWLDAIERKYVEEVGTMNLFAVIDGELVTPPLGDTILPGVTRDSILTLAKEWGLRASQRRISLEEIVAADRSAKLQEIFGCGTAAVLSRVGQLAGDGFDIALPMRDGSYAQRFYDAITNVQYGLAPDTHGWLKEVRQG